MEPGRAHGNPDVVLVGGRARLCPALSPLFLLSFAASVPCLAAFLRVAIGPLFLVSMPCIEQPAHCFLNKRNAFRVVTGVFVLLRKFQ